MDLATRMAQWDPLPECMPALQAMQDSSCVTSLSLWSISPMGHVRITLDRQLSEAGEGESLRAVHRFTWRGTLRYDHDLLPPPARTDWHDHGQEPYRTPFLAFEAAVAAVRGAALSAPPPEPIPLRPPAPRRGRRRGTERS